MHMCTQYSTSWVSQHHSGLSDTIANLTVTNTQSACSLWFHSHHKGSAKHEHERDGTKNEKNENNLSQYVYIYDILAAKEIKIFNPGQGKWSNEKYRVLEVIQRVVCKYFTYLQYKWTELLIIRKSHLLGSKCRLQKSSATPKKNKIKISKKLFPTTVNKQCHSILPHKMKIYLAEAEHLRELYHKKSPPKGKARNSYLISLSCIIKCN